MALRGKTKKSESQPQSQSNTLKDGIAAAIEKEIAAQTEQAAETDTVAAKTKIETPPDKPSSDAPTEGYSSAEEPAKKAVVPKVQAGVPEKGGIFLQNEQLVEVAMSAEFGDLPKIVAASGKLKEREGNLNLGERVTFTPVLAKVRWCVAPGSNEEEAKEYFVVDYDSPENLEDALQEAIEAGYTKAKIKKYLEVYGLILNCEEAPELEGELVQFQLSPTSVRQWKKFSNKLKVRHALGRLPTENAIEIVAMAVADTWDGNDFTRFGFEVAN